MKRTKRWIHRFAIAPLALGALVALPAPTTVAAATVLYVDGANPSCSNSGPGTSTQPYCTIQKGASVATAGTTVQVAAATYAENVSPWNSGAAGTPIVFAAAPGATVTGTAAGSNGFTISGKSYITIQNFTITNTVGSGISAFDSTTPTNNIVITGNHVSQSGRSTDSTTIKRAISFTGVVTASTVTGNVIDHNTGSGVYLGPSTSGNAVTHNTISYSASGITDSSGVYQRLSPGIDVRGSGNTIVANVSHDNDDSGIQLFQGATNNLVANNACYHNRGYPVAAAGDHGIDVNGSTNNVLIGNSVYDNVTAGINVEGSSTGTVVADNVSVNNGINSPRSKGNLRVDSTSQSGTTIDYDLVYLTSSGTVVVWGSTSYPSLAAFQAAAPGQETHGVQADPRWVAPASGDFHLSAGSPAIDSANSGVSGEQVQDADGRSRFDDPLTPNTGAGPRPYDDRGAYEYQGGIG
ncbi:MAG TPA: right-handed parallel beta-helix repeat-containing protein [Candidatus Dormibacteraeota bacterium]|nr:right-handed parallel beta-helix repeat-containing protein [Candidatus Dormibacteraeota bacterium]